MEDQRRLRVRVLGPIEVRDPAGRDVTPDGLLQRRLLALLVLRRDTVVSVDALVDTLWTAEPPRDPAAAVQTHLFRLRRTLPALHIRSSDHGYGLDASSVDVDAARLDDALHRAMAGDDGAGDELESVLASWSGDAYPELADTDEGRVEAMRLAELRTAALERRAEARLAAGDTDGLVAELSAMAEADPLRERPRALLMDALAATGRIAEALRVYDDYRRAVAQELGIEPSAELNRRHGELLVGGGGAWRPATVLPVALTSLVGRDELVEQCLDLLAECRLLSLVGPGGVGKTRLLLELGRRLRDGRPECPVVLCELARATPSSAADVVAGSLGIEGRPGTGIEERLPVVLADAELTLLLDNCEHVLEPVAVLVERVLAAAPGVRIVVTTRERLRVVGEQVCPVPMLPVAGDEGPAEALFLERARAVVPGFEPSDAERTLIGDVVRQLDGLPLAIELAAARLRTMELSEVVAGLDQRFQLLDAGSRTNPRHRSLHAAVSWSVGMLDDRLRVVFDALSVFSTPFRVEDAAAVCGLSVGDAAAALDPLVERSLVERAPGRKYTLLDSLKAFGAESLAEHGQSEVVRDRHAAHAADWVAHVDRTMNDPGHEDGLLAIDRELPELRSALRWLLERHDVDRAGRLVAALQEYVWLRMRPDLGEWAEWVAAADPEDRGSHAPTVWTMAAIASWLLGDLTETGRRNDRARRAAAVAGVDAPGPVVHWDGTVAMFAGRLDDALGHYALAKEIDRDHRGRYLTTLGTEILVLGYSGQLEAADARATAMLDEVGDDEGPHAAFAWYAAGEADLTGDLDRARHRFDRALELAEATGNAFVSGVAGTSDASIDLRRGDFDRAAARYRSLLGHWRRAGVWSTQWTTLRSVALVLEGLGRHREAAILAGAVFATDEGHGIYGDDAVALQALQERLRATLGADAHRALVAEGAELDGHGAVELVLRSL